MIDDIILKKIEIKFKEQFILWNTKSLNDVIPNCNYEPMLNNLMGIIKSELNLKNNNKTNDNSFI